MTSTTPEMLVGAPKGEALASPQSLSWLKSEGIVPEEQTPTAGQVAEAFVSAVKAQQQEYRTQGKLVDITPKTLGAERKKVAVLNGTAVVPDTITRCMCYACGGSDALKNPSVFVAKDKSLVAEGACQYCDQHNVIRSPQKATVTEPIHSSITTQREVQRVIVEKGPFDDPFFADAQMNFFAAHEVAQREAFFGRKDPFDTPFFREQNRAELRRLAQPKPERVERGFMASSQEADYYPGDPRRMRYYESGGMTFGVGQLPDGSSVIRVPVSLWNSHDVVMAMPDGTDKPVDPSRVSKHNLRITMPTQGYSVDTTPDDFAVKCGFSPVESVMEVRVPTDAGISLVQRSRPLAVADTGGLAFLGKLALGALRGRK